jgi:hypothetical protein
MKKPAPSAGTVPGTTLTPFQFSRLYARGWTAGRSGDFDVPDGDFNAATAAHNPGRTAAERARWLKGFTEGFRGGSL